MIDLAEWPALVLTAGLATRLRPLSDVRAKAAMPVTLPISLRKRSGTSWKTAPLPRPQDAIATISSSVSGLSAGPLATSA